MAARCDVRGVAGILHGGRRHLTQTQSGVARKGATPDR